MSGFPQVAPQFSSSLIGLDGGKNVQMGVGDIVSMINNNIVSGLRGTATTTTMPTSPIDGNYYITTGPGTYTNFKDSTNTAIVVLSTDNFAYLLYNGTYWTKIAGAITLTGYVTTASIVDNLTSNDATVPLSAKQGKALAALIPTGIGSDAIVTSYPIDFTPLTTTSGANGTFINSVPVAVAGQLTSLRIKTSIAATVTVYVYSVTGTTGSFVFTLLHTYPTFVTGSTTHTQTITDTYLIPAGAFVGIKSTANIFYLGGFSGYGMQPSSVSYTTNKVAYDFVITVPPSGLYGRMSTVETTLSPLPAQISSNTTAIGTPVAYPHTIDFTPLTLSGGAGTTYFNYSPTEVDGILTQVRVQGAVGGIVTPSAYNIVFSGGVVTFTLLHTYASFSLTSSPQTVNISDSFLIPTGSFIGFVSTGTRNYTTVSSGTGAYQLGLTTGRGNVVLAQDFTIKQNFPGTLDYRVSALEVIPAQITDIQTNYLKGIQLKPAVLYSTIFSSLTDFSQVGWSISSGVAVPSGVGSANYLWLQRRYQVTPRTLSFEVTLLSDSVFYIDCAPFGVYPFGNGVFAISASTNQLIMYDRLPAGGLGGPLTQTSIGTISFTMVSGRRYTIELDLDDWTNTFTIRDTVTANSYSLSLALNTGSYIGQNTQQDSYKLYLQSGTTTGVKLHNLRVSSKLNPLLMIIGDSITAGVYFATSTYAQRYGSLLRTALKGNVLISARGGDTLVDDVDGTNNKIQSEVAFIKPVYVMMTIGTNNGFTNTQLTTACNNIIALGSKVILNHVPNRGDGSHVAKNAIIDAVCAANPTNIILGAKFDVATSIGNDPANSYIVASYFDSGVHPNVAGHAAMYARFAVDVPFLLR
jgi:lysophospholipase L1-like esterase